VADARRSGRPLDILVVRRGAASHSRHGFTEEVVWPDTFRFARRRTTETQLMFRLLVVCTLLAAHPVNVITVAGVYRD
jgi:hypothetical protein